MGKARKFSILHFGSSVFTKTGQLFSRQKMLILLDLVIVTLATEQLHHFSTNTETEELL